MIVNKKGFFLGLLLSLLGIGNVMQAYSWAFIKNSTPYPVSIEASYLSGHTDWSCESESIYQKLDPGHTTKIPRFFGPCHLIKVFASVYQKGIRPVKIEYEVGHLVDNYKIDIGGIERTGYKITSIKLSKEEEAEILHKISQK